MNSKLKNKRGKAVMSINKQLDRQLSRQSQTQETGRKIFTKDERYVIDAFYFRLSNIYGTRFKSQFPNEQSLSASKMEWGQLILEKGAEKLHQQLERVKRENATDAELAWPNLGYLLSLSTGRSPTGINSAAYLPAPRRDNKRSSPETGRTFLSAMKEMLG